uniref:Uncharacterized protein n=1 Tax=mine drainage metagenome TaxID=410659 RepID=E6PMN8_9ZZZZ
MCCQLSGAHGPCCRPAQVNRPLEGAQQDLRKNHTHALPAFHGGYALDAQDNTPKRCIWPVRGLVHAHRIAAWSPWRACLGWAWPRACRVTLAGQPLFRCGTGLADVVLAFRIHRRESQHGSSYRIENRRHHRRRRCSQQPVVPGHRIEEGADQGRHPAFAFGHHGHFRDRAERRGLDDHRRNQRRGRRGRPHDRTRGGGPGLQLAAVRGKGAPAHFAGQGGRHFRLLDLGVAQVGAAGARRAQRPAVLPGAVRGPGGEPACGLHGCGAQPASHSRYRIPDEQGRRGRPPLLPAGHRLRVPAHHQRHPARLPAFQGREGCRHRRGLHPLRLQQLPEHRRRHQEIRLGRAHLCHLHREWRLQRAVLQRAGQPGHQGDRHSGGRLLHRRAGNRRHGPQAPGRPAHGVELLRVAEEPDQRQVRQVVAGLGQDQGLEGLPRDRRPDGSLLHRHPHVEAGSGESQVHQDRRRAQGAHRPEVRRAGWLHRRGAEEPVPEQAGVHRPDSRRRPVRRGVEVQWPGPGRVLEPVHPQAEERLSIGKGNTPHPNLPHAVVEEKTLKQRFYVLVESLPTSPSVGEEKTPSPPVGRVGEGSLAAPICIAHAS